MEPLPSGRERSQPGIGQEIATTPDAANRVREIKTNDGETIVAFGYDEANRKIWEDQTVGPPPGQSTAISHRVRTDLDHDGNRINLQIVEPPGEGGEFIISPEMSGTGQYSIAYTYTGRNQLKTISGEDWLFTYVYDPSGNLSSRRADYNGGINWTKCPNDGYDALNRPTKWEQTGPDGFYALSHYRYDKANREEATWRAENGNRGENYEYEITNQLKKVSYNVTITPTPAPPSPTPPNATPTPPNATPTPGQQVAMPTFDPDGDNYHPDNFIQITLTTTTVGAQISWTKDGTPPTPTNGTVIPSGGTLVSLYRESFFLRAIAFKPEMANSVENSAEYTWDNGDAPHAAGRTVTYSHTPDKLNRSSMNDTGVETNYLPNALNQYTSTPGNSFSYDTNFNLTHTAGLYGVYDAANRLVAASNGGSGEAGQTTAGFVYDGLGRCVKRTLSGVGATVFVYDGWKPIGEFDEWGYFQAWNVFGPGPDEILLRQKDKIGYTRFLLDRHGNVAFLVDNDGVIQEKYSYDVFGHPRVTDGNGANARSWSYYEHDFMFQGREYIRQLGIYDYRNRFYHPGLGRFIQTDPIGLQTEGDKLSAQQKALYVGGTAPETFNYSEPNLYRFCNNDPVNRSDPFGLNALFMVGANRENPSYFTKIAQAWAKKYEATHKGQEAAVVQVRTKQDVTNALKQSENLDRVDYVGHSSSSNLFLSDKGVLSKRDVASLPTENMKPGASIMLSGCNTGRGKGSIAEAFANRFGQSVIGTHGGLSFGLPLVNRITDATNPIPRTEGTVAGIPYIFVNPTP